MPKGKLSLVALLAAVLLVFAATADTAMAGKPQVGKPCVMCHKQQADVIRGKLGARSDKFSTLQVKVGKLVWVLKYDGGTRVAGAKDIASIPKGKEVAVTFTGDSKTALAKAVSVKQPYTVPEEQKITVDEVKKLIQPGGDFMLVDARPTPRFLEGHIPGAVSLPYAAFDKKHASVLPRDKDKLVVFYCGGTT